MAKKRKQPGPKKSGAKRTQTPATGDKAAAAADLAAATAAVTETTAPPTPAKVTITEDKPSLGQQRRAAQREARVSRERTAATSPATPADPPAFFFGFEITWAKLVLARVIFFLLLAYDALEQISHAPRYGAGNFNVPQIGFLDAVAPGRELYSAAQLVSAYLLVLAASGVATRVVIPIATVIYGWLYFSSQLDSYQHHYLVWLLLVLSCFVPWQRPVSATPATRVRSWALRLILIQLAIVYFWAAISKMNPAWLDGQTLDKQLSGTMEGFIKSTVGYKTAALSVIVVELVLAATIWWRGGWKFAWWLGLALHITILKTGFDIGLFAWLMIGLYVLVIPDRIWVWVSELPPLRWVREVVGVIQHWFHGSARFIVWVTAAIAGAVLAMVSRFEDAPAIGLALVMALVVGTSFAVFRRRTHVAWLAIAHLLAFVMWTTVDRATSTAMDYYRLWGGSSRRLGDQKTAEEAYRKMTEVAPDNAQGFYQLGRLLLAREAGEEGIAALHQAQNLEPLKARAYVAEARWLSTHGRRNEAIDKAREATIVEPADPEAKALLDSLLGQR